MIFLTLNEFSYDYLGAKLFVMAILLGRKDTTLLKLLEIQKEQIIPHNDIIIPSFI